MLMCNQSPRAAQVICKLVVKRTRQEGKDKTGNKLIEQYQAISRCTKHQNSSSMKSADAHSSKGAMLASEKREVQLEVLPISSQIQMAARIHGQYLGQS